MENYSTSTVRALETTALELAPENDLQLSELDQIVQTMIRPSTSVLLATSGLSVQQKPSSLAAYLSAEKQCQVSELLCDTSISDLPSPYKDFQFDSVVFLNSLEYSTDPSALLAASKRILRADSSIILAVPNISHAARRMALLSGNSVPEEILGPGVRTTFTRSTLSKLLGDLQLIDVRWESVQGNTLDSRLAKRFRKQLSPAVIEEIESDKDAKATSFVIEVLPSPSKRFTELLLARQANLDEVIATALSVNRNLEMRERRAREELAFWKGSEVELAALKGEMLVLRQCLARVRDEVATLYRDCGLTAEASNSPISQFLTRMKSVEQTLGDLKQSNDKLAGRVERYTNLGPLKWIRGFRRKLLSR